MKVLFAASEALPFVKTGGLGDVMGALPRELSKQGVETAVVLPLYNTIKQNMDEDIEFVGSCSVSLAWRNLYCGVFRCERGGVTYFFIDNEYYFNRPAPYGQDDDGERFAFFSKAVLESLRVTGFIPDVIHANDWQSALIPLFYKANYRQIVEYSRIKTVFTIHNIEYQGWCAYSFLSDVCGVPREYTQAMELGSAVNLVKGAVVLADAVTTVSETYAKELQYSFYSHGLENIISMYNYKLTGITNGIDTEEYDPATDRVLSRNYTAADLEGKRENKRSLQKELGLYDDGNALVVAMVSRLVGHKGFDLVQFVFHDLMRANIQFVLLGTGEYQYEEFFREMAEAYPGRVSANIRFDGALSHRIYAGADALLMPSKTEPCGLSQLIAMRYGTVPVVRETGGLADTVRAITAESPDGRGFRFRTYNAHDMLESVWAAVGLFGDKTGWHRAVTACMNYDSGWEHPSGRYLALYENLLK